MYGTLIAFEQSQEVIIVLDEQNDWVSLAVQAWESSLEALGCRGRVGEIDELLPQGNRGRHCRLPFPNYLFDFVGSAADEKTRLRIRRIITHLRSERPRPRAVILLPSDDYSWDSFRDDYIKFHRHGADMTRCLEFLAGHTEEAHVRM